MTQETTIEGNKRIAIFMGYKQCSVMVKSIGEMLGFEKDGNKIPIDEIEYHTSWDWLMQVVEKIEGEGYKVIITTYDTRIEYVPNFKHPSFHAEHGGGLEDEKIHHAYSAVLQFITWYTAHLNDPEGGRKDKK
jgi:hypothetical protein